MPTAEAPVRAPMAPNLLQRFVLVYTIPRAALRAALDGLCQALTVRALTTLPLH